MGGKSNGLQQLSQNVTQEMCLSLRIAKKKKKCIQQHSQQPIQICHGSAEKALNKRIGPGT